MTQPDNHRSYSQLNTYRRCGTQYRLTRIDHAPERPNAAAVAGSAVHTATEFLDRMENPLTVDALHDTLDFADTEFTVVIGDYQAKGWMPTEFKHYGRQDLGWWRQTGVPNSISAYWNWRKDFPTLRLMDLPEFGPAIEVPFNIEFDGGLQVHGHIDRIFDVDDVHIPVDLKSGARPKTDEQLGLYARALEATYGLQCDWGFYLYGLKSGEAKLSAPLRLNHWTFAKLGEVYRMLDQGIQQNIFIPHPGEECFHCPVSDSCPFLESVV